MKNIKIDIFSLFAYSLAIIIAIFGLLVWFYDIEILIPNRAVPDMLNKPCSILFFMLALIFFAVGSASSEEEN